MMIHLKICILLIGLISASQLPDWDEMENELEDDRENEIEDDQELLCDETACDDYECPEIDDCEYGFVPDVCQCCFTCAKGPGEQCGGLFDLAGTCAVSYYCKLHPKYSQLPGICILESY